LRKAHEARLGRREDTVAPTCNSSEVGNDFSDFFGIVRVVDDASSKYIVSPHCTLAKKTTIHPLCSSNDSGKSKWAWSRRAYNRIRNYCW
jgi:hypothetical protein